MSTVKDLDGVFRDFPKTEKYPVLFVGHGSPMNGAEDNIYSRAWKKLGETLPRPKAILAISAHWLGEKISVDISSYPKTIYDFFGFPEELYTLTYPAHGAPLLAEATRTMLHEYEVEKEEYGLDHGAWIVLRRMYPKADIPVFQLAIDLEKPPSYHYDLGKALAPLRERGVLILGSGNIVHNLRTIDWRLNAEPKDWAIEFDARVATLLQEGKHDALCAYNSITSSALLAVPTPDHYYPFLYTLGASGEGARVTFPVEGITLGSISMRSVLFS